MTSRLFAAAVLGVLLLGGDAPAKEPLKSGPPVGAGNDRRGFLPQYVAGAFTGERRCPV
jgi:hypothetical protein